MPRRCTSRMSRPMRARRSSRPTFAGTLILLEEAARARRPRLRHDLDDQRLRRRAETPARSAGGLDRRERRAGPEEHLRRHQDRGRGPLPIVPPQRGPGVDRAQDLALLSGRGRRSGGAKRLSPTTTRRRTNTCFAASRSRTSSTRISSRPSARRQSASGNTSSARRRRSCPTDCAAPARRRAGGRQPARAGMGG